MREKQTRRWWSIQKGHPATHKFGNYLRIARGLTPLKSLPPIESAYIGYYFSRCPSPRH